VRQVWSRLWSFQVQRGPRGLPLRGLPLRVERRHLRVADDEAFGLRGRSDGLKEVERLRLREALTAEIRPAMNQILAGRPRSPLPCVLGEADPVPARGKIEPWSIRPQGASGAATTPPGTGEELPMQERMPGKSATQVAIDVLRALREPLRTKRSGRA
jgi:hypothetical protein